MGEPIYSRTVPAYAFAQWDGSKLLNGDSSLPLWSGKGEPPAIGSKVTLQGSKRYTVIVDRYTVEGQWLMAWGIRDDGKRGNVAGAEIAYPKDAPKHDEATIQWQLERMDYTRDASGNWIEGEATRADAIALLDWLTAQNEESAQ